MKLPIQLSKDSREPIYHQIEKQLKALIAGGHLEAGASLPSIRVLSKDLGVSIITTRRAYQNLENEGFIETIQGKGTFVATIDRSLKEATKESAVYDAFKQAVEIAKNYDYTLSEIEQLLKTVISEYKKGE